MSDRSRYTVADLETENTLPTSFSFACPQCGTPLEICSPTTQECPVDGLAFERKDGIWCFLLPVRAAYFRQFLHEYETVRRAEGRGSTESAYYQALPFKDLTGRFDYAWHIRATSYRAFVAHTLDPLEARTGHPLTMLDLGAGNGWLSYRLAQRGHRVAAVDLQTSSVDGLGTYRHYDHPFMPVQAEFDALPFAAQSFDLVLFNASLHYSTDYAVTLGEALRVLRPGGSLNILDSPVYRDGASGAQMVQEQEMAFERLYGFASNALPCEQYLTEDRLNQLAATLGLRWRIHTPRYGLRWRTRPWIARLLHRRDPARFLLITGTIKP